MIDRIVVEGSYLELELSDELIFDVPHAATQKTNSSRIQTRMIIWMVCRNHNNNERRIVTHSIDFGSTDLGRG